MPALSAQVIPESESSLDENLPSESLRMQTALRALATAIESTRRYFSVPWASEADWVAQAELAEHWANAASCLAGVDERALARKCLRNVQCWQQLNPYLVSTDSANGIAVEA